MIYVLGRMVGQLEPTQMLSLDPANAQERNDFLRRDSSFGVAVCGSALASNFHV